MRVLDLFSGIGGFSLGLERAGMETVAFCEIDPFCRKVLKKHWPDVPIFEDIKTLRGDEVGSVDVVCGGFPCQPFSCAGLRQGKEDDRFLWPEMFRIIRETRPTWVIGENVAGFIGMEFDNCAADLEAEGYEVQAFIIPACAVNAPHRRDRVWIVANRADTGLKILRQERENTVLQTANDRPTSQNPIGGRNGGRDNGDQAGMQCSLQNVWDEPWIEAATRLCGVDARVSNRVDRLKCLGNAVVPQIPEIIGCCIMAIESGKVPQKRGA